MLPPRSAAGVAATAVFLLCVAVAPARADTYTVTRTDDPAPDACLPADCSLREALNASNTSTTVDDLVEVPAASEPYVVDLGTLDISDEVEVRGVGADRVVIDGGEKDLLVSTGATGPIVLVGVTLRKGKGAIQNTGPLTLRGVSVEKNFRSGAGGGIQNNGPLLIESSFIGFNGTDGISGGGIQSNAKVTVINSTVAWNESMASSGILSNDPATLISSALVFNTSGGAASPGASAFPLTLRDSVLAENFSTTGIVNCGVETVSLGGNVEDVSTCGLGAGDRPNTSPGVGALGLYGGTTPVHSVSPGGGAVDAAGACPPLDQRGAPRPSGTACDSGPFELQQPLTPLGQTPTAAADRTVLLALGPKRLRLSRRGIARLRLTCPVSEQSPPCRGSVVLRELRASFDEQRSRAVLARARFSLAAGESRRTRLKLAAAKFEFVQSHPAATRVLALVQVADAAGNRALIQRRLRLILPR